MSEHKLEAPNLDVKMLREAIRAEYAEVAAKPNKGFHFHTGRSLARILEYKDEWLEDIPELSIESFAGTGNPFSLGDIAPDENVIDIGCGAGIDSLIASGMAERVVGVDMSEDMLAKARKSAAQAGRNNVEFRKGYGEELPVRDGWADVVISNGVLNLMPDKPAALAEMWRVLKPDGRLQIGDILVQKPVPEGVKRDIDLWTG